MNSLKYLLIALILPSVLAACGSHGGKLTQIKIIPSQSTIATGTREHFLAWAIFADGTMVNWTSATEWSTSDTSLVSISNEFDTYGLAHSISYAPTGTIIITGKDLANYISSTATLSVVDPVGLYIVPNNPFMKTGANHSFRTEAKLSSDPTLTFQDITSYVTWTTADPTIATVSKGGVVSTHATGSTNLITSYTFSSLVTGVTQTTYSAVITVRTDGLQSLTLSSAPSFTSGGIVSLGTGTMYFSATGNFVDAPSTVDFTQSAKWTSSNSKIATISDEPGSKGTCTLLKTGGPVTIKAFDPVTGHGNEIRFTVQ